MGSMPIYSTKKIGSIYIFSTITILMIMKNYKCEICEIDFETFQAKANHVRWNHKDNTTYLAKLRASGPRIERITEIVCCEKCNKAFDVTYNKGNKKHKRFCSYACSNVRVHTAESKEKIRQTLRGGKTMYDKETTVRCPGCKKTYQTRKKYKKFCTVSCGSKSRSRKLLQSKTFRQIYKHFTKFQFSLKSYPNDFNFDLIEEHGWYKAKNRGDNLGGITRDHVLSVTDGMNQMINPLFLAHPANCRLMRQCDNASKGSESRLTIEELCARIKEWNVDHEEEFSAENPYIEKKDVIAMIAE